jgi:hypothetical protein
MLSLSLISVLLKQHQGASVFATDIFVFNISILLIPAYLFKHTGQFIFCLL